MCALVRPSRDTYKSKETDGHKICSVVRLSRVWRTTHERTTQMFVKQFTATTEGSKEHTDLGQPVKWIIIYQNRLASKFIIKIRNSIAISSNPLANCSTTLSFQNDYFLLFSVFWFLRSVHILVKDITMCGQEFMLNQFSWDFCMN